MAKIDLKELAEQLDFMFDGWSYFVNRKTGEIISIDDTHLGIAEELDESDEIPDEFSEWESDAIEQARELLDNWDDMIRLPSKEELREYDMMEDFTESVKDAHIRDCLEISIQGRGAFRRFKDTAIRFGVIDSWYEFKSQALMEYAKEWCEMHDLEF